MPTYSFNNATPFEAIHVGEYISDDLAAMGMTQKELSQRTGIPAPHINQIIKGKRRITAEQSIAIAQIMGYEDALLYMLQAQHDIDKAKLAKQNDVKSSLLKIAAVL